MQVYFSIPLIGSLEDVKEKLDDMIKFTWKFNDEETTNIANLEFYSFLINSRANESSNDSDARDKLSKLREERVLSIIRSDLVYFHPLWETSDVCSLEKNICETYNISYFIIPEDALSDDACCGVCKHHGQIDGFDMCNLRFECCGEMIFSVIEQDYSCPFFERKQS